VHVLLEVITRGLTLLTQLQRERFLILYFKNDLFIYLFIEYLLIFFINV